ncbi:MAG: hypothetical protein AAB708_01855 [Patescibacteria group bacterium]
MFSFLKPKPEELQYQIDQYDSLSLFKSYRGQSILIFIGIFALDIALSILNIRLHLMEDVSGAGVLFLLIPLLLFIWFIGIVLATPFLVMLNRGSKIAPLFLLLIIGGVIFFTLAGDLFIGFNLRGDSSLQVFMRFFEITVLILALTSFIHRLRLMRKVEILHTQKISSDGSTFQINALKYKKRGKGCLIIASIVSILYITAIGSSMYKDHKTSHAVPAGLMGPTEKTFPGYTVSVRPGTTFTRDDGRNTYRWEYYPNKPVDGYSGINFSIGSNNKGTYEKDSARAKESHSETYGPQGANAPRIKQLVDVYNFEYQNSPGVVYFYESSWSKDPNYKQGYAYDLHWNDGGSDVNITLNNIPKDMYSNEQVVDILKTLKRY